MKKSQFWLFREGIARDLGKMFNRLDEFLTNYDKKHEATQYKVLKLERQITKLLKKK